MMHLWVPTGPVLLQEAGCAWFLVGRSLRYLADRQASSRCLARAPHHAGTGVGLSVFVRFL
jgi:hypothetical protein